MNAPVPAITRGLSKAQIEWARQHDWYRARFVSMQGQVHGVVAVERVRAEDGNVTEEEIAFDDFRELRKWAGYA